jgi:hypothetical protein
MSSWPRSSRLAAWTAAAMSWGLAATAQAGQAPDLSASPAALAEARLRVPGAIPTPLDLGAADISALPHQEARAERLHHCLRVPA